MFRNPVGGPRIVPFGHPRKPTDYLRNGHPGFRVTQRFYDWDALFHNAMHGAMDIANYNCGDNVFAMGDGWCQRLRDPNGALGVRVNHPNGYKTECWHLGRLTVLDGQQVLSGKKIGEVGSTGLVISGCHVHVVVINPVGRKIDPWPLLNQNT